MSQLLLLTNSSDASVVVLPALGLLSHRVRVLSAEPSALLDAPPADALLVDGRSDLMTMRGLCRVIRTTGVAVPVLLVATEGGLAGVTSEWGIDDFLLDSAGPAEVEARLRLALSRTDDDPSDDADLIRSGELVVDESAYSARLRNSPLNLTYKSSSFSSIWSSIQVGSSPAPSCCRRSGATTTTGHPDCGRPRSTATRAKLGPEHEHLIGTVRNVGYRFVAPLDEEVMAE